MTLVYRAIEEMSQEQIDQVLAATTTEPADLWTAVYSALYYHEIEYAAQCVIRGLQRDAASSRATEVVESYIQMRSTTGRVGEMIELLLEAGQTERKIKGVRELFKIIERSLLDED